MAPPTGPYRTVVFFPISMVALPLSDIRICCICLDPTLSAPTINAFEYSLRQA